MIPREPDAETDELQVKRRPVSLEICDDAQTLVRARAPMAQGLRYGAELRELWDPKGDPERLITRGVLCVALATRGEETQAPGDRSKPRRLVGWGELLVGRPAPGEPTAPRGLCKVSRLDVAPAYRRRAFADSSSRLPVSELLLSALVGAAPFGADLVAEVTPDAENLFEQAGFRVYGPGRWRLTR
ncbi:MAG: hypothetical protein ACYCWW_06600 [Deltaproteobacteria bacterium]